ncbi:unnamed protein product, partial [Amoebophrya sp. A25]
ENVGSSFVALIAFGVSGVCCSSDSVASALQTSLEEHGKNGFTGDSGFAEWGLLSA